MQLDLILLDVDGVLGDFIGHALKYHGREDLKVTQWNTPELMGITDAEFWAPIDNYEFWISEPVYPGAHRFVESLRQIAPILFSTSPSMSPMCAAAKIEWLRRHFGPVTPADYMIGSRKYLMAGPDRLLIDDNEKNLREFAEWGGLSMRFPRTWNDAKADGTYDMALAYIKERLGATQVDG